MGMKREMRAVWIATVDNIDWPSRKNLPPTAGAVANAFFKATGKRLYNQPSVKQKEMKGISLV